MCWLAIIFFTECWRDRQCVCVCSFKNKERDWTTSQECPPVKEAEEEDKMQNMINPEDSKRNKTNQIGDWSLRERIPANN